MIGLGFFIGSEGGGFGHDLRWLRMGGAFFMGWMLILCCILLSSVG